MRIWPNENHIPLILIQSVISGRSNSMHLDIIPKSTPSLALRIAGNKTIIKYGDPIPGKLYRSQSPKNEYDIKLCQISME